MKQRLFLPLILLAVIVGVIQGCGGTGDPSADTGACGESADVVMRASDGQLGPGSYKISGSITLASAAASGTYVQLSVDRISLPFSAEVTSTSLNNVQVVVNYLVCNLPAGDYTVRLRTDRNGNLSYNDPGDEDGYFAGTTIAPVQSSASATPITITFSDVLAGFGIAP